MQKRSIGTRIASLADVHARPAADPWAVDTASRAACRIVKNTRHGMCLTSNGETTKV